MSWRVIESDYFLGSLRQSEVIDKQLINWHHFVFAITDVVGGIMEFLLKYLLFFLSSSYEAEVWGAPLGS